MKRFSHALGLSAAIVCGIAFPELAAGQSAGLFGGSGPLGQSAASRGSSLSSVGGGLGSTAGGGMGAGGMSGGLGGGGGNNRGVLGNTGIAGSGAQLGQGGFIGATNNNGAMVGVSQNGQAGQGANGNNAGRQSSFGGAQRLGGGNANALNRQATNPNGGGQSPPSSGSGRPVVKPRLRVAFDYNRPAAIRTETLVEQRLEGLNRRITITGLQVAVAAGTVTLQGTVKSENDRKVAEALARLEPGVRNVQNLLVVRGGALPSEAETEE